MENSLRKAEHLAIDPPVVIDCQGKAQYIQKWFVASFISPEDRIQQRFIFEANRFLYYDINKQLMDTTSNVVRNINTDLKNLLEKKIESFKTANDPAYKQVSDLLQTILTNNELALNEDAQVNKTLRTYRLEPQELTDRFETYKVQNSTELETEFNKMYTDETSVRGFKVRCNFEDIEVARAHAKKVREEIEPFVHTFVGPVGYWVPFDPNADAVQDQEYMVPELNNLMGQRKRNEEQKNDFFAKRKLEMMENANSSREKELKDKLHQKLTEQRNQRTKK